MNTITCERALQLAGQADLSGEVLAACWHVRQCPQCQRMLDDLHTQITMLDDRVALARLLGIDLSGAICKTTERAITWLEDTTHQVLVEVIRLGDLSAPLVAPRYSFLGPVPEERDRVLQQYEEETPDGSLKWKVTYVVESHDPNHFTADVEVAAFDRWDLTGIQVYLVAETERRRQETDARGTVQFTHIPVELLGKTNIILLPQRPSQTNGAQ